MKSTFIFILLIYWSIIILAPVLSKENALNKNQKIITPKEKPSK